MNRKRSFPSYYIVYPVKLSNIAPVQQQVGAGYRCWTDLVPMCIATRTACTRRSRTRNMSTC